jgi:kynurenine 3-monooxygenase
MSTPQRKIAVVGAGLVGSLQTLFLARRGFNVDVFERRPDIRKSELQGGRSINLALSDRGWLALERAGVADAVREVSIPMFERIIHAVDGTITRQPYGKEGQAIYSVSRGGLNKTILEHVDANPRVSLHFDCRCIDLDPEAGRVSFVSEVGGEKNFIFDHIFGTDGAFSAVRSRLQRIDRFNFSQEYLSHGYKELCISANPDGTHRLEKNALHIWPRNEFMLIALPNLDGSFTVTLFFPFEGAVSFQSLDSASKAETFFATTFPDALKHMPDLGAQFFSNPTSSLVMIKCDPWYYRDKVLLMGDASHAIVPFYGQGMNAGFEDCRIFDEMSSEIATDWETLFREFSERRKPDADAILELALRNYIEMRDKTADPEFLLQKKIENRFARKYPERWLPLYSQVTFSHIPYSKALADGDMQEEIMRRVMDRPDIEKIWDSDEIEQEILMELQKRKG